MIGLFLLLALSSSVGGVIGAFIVLSFIESK
jgi:hypothetical protein